MGKMIQVRNVPDRLHRELMRRARAEGQTLTAYVEELLRQEIARPPRREVFERIARSTPTDLGGPAAEILRDQRRRS